MPKAWRPHSYPMRGTQEWFLGNMQSMYGMELRSFWDRKQWPEVVAIIKKQKAVDIQGKNSAMIAEKS